tara:strand:- start:330 stop:479 length:150 start_codon:yes stop_codon:yes gene_type:complete
MILYLETQLDKAYNVYMKNSMKQSKPYMTKEEFRTMFEELMEVVYENVD